MMKNKDVQTFNWPASVTLPMDRPATAREQARIDKTVKRMGGMRPPQIYLDWIAKEMALLPKRPPVVWPADVALPDAPNATELAAISAVVRNDVVGYARTHELSDWIRRWLGGDKEAQHAALARIGITMPHCPNCEGDPPK